MPNTKSLICSTFALIVLGSAVHAGNETVGDNVIAAQRAKLAEATNAKG